MTKELSEKQKEILKLIETSIADSGYAPTVREIASEIGVKSPRSVSHHLEQLEKMGYIKRTQEGVRNIMVTCDDNDNPLKDLVKVPLCGWTAGGEPILAEQNILDWIPISTRFFKTGSDEIFLLKVRGDSMSPRIEDGDVVIVKKQYQANPGDTVVGLIGEETTVKKYLPREDHIVLQPENPSHEPIVVFPDELRIQGIVQGVMKYY